MLLTITKPFQFNGDIFNFLKQNKKTSLKRETGGNKTNKMAPFSFLSTSNLNNTRTERLKKKKK